MSSKASLVCLSDFDLEVESFRRRLNTLPRPSLLTALPEVDSESQHPNHLISSEILASLHQ